MRRLDEVKPSAYLFKTLSGLTLGVSVKDGAGAIPLYKVEQISPRVKMTKKQYKEFIGLKEDKVTFYHFWQHLLVVESSLIRNIPEHDLMLAWIDVSAIEIAPEKKWFVKHIDHNQFLYLKDDKFNYLTGKKDAARFDTEEEAKQWENPKAKAVLLDVDN